MFFSVLSILIVVGFSFFYFQHIPATSTYDAEEMVQKAQFLNNQVSDLNELYIPRLLEASAQSGLDTAAYWIKNNADNLFLEDQCDLEAAVIQGGFDVSTIGAPSSFVICDYGSPFVACNDNTDISIEGNNRFFFKPDISSALRLDPGLVLIQQFTPAADDEYRNFTFLTNDGDGTRNFNVGLRTYHCNDAGSYSILSHVDTAKIKAGTLTIDFGENISLKEGRSYLLILQVIDAPISLILADSSEQGAAFYNMNFTSMLEPLAGNSSSHNASVYGLLDKVFAMMEEEMNFNVDFNISEINIFHISPYDINISLNFSYSIEHVFSDWHVDETILEETVSIIGLSDPFYERNITQPTLRWCDPFISGVNVRRIQQFSDVQFDIDNFTALVQSGNYTHSTNAPSFLQRFFANVTPSAYGIYSIINDSCKIPGNDNMSFVDYKFLAKEDASGLCLYDASTLDNIDNVILTGAEVTHYGIGPLDLYADHTGGTCADPGP